MFCSCSYAYTYAYAYAYNTCLLHSLGASTLTNSYYYTDPRLAMYSAGWNTAVLAARPTVYQRRRLRTWERRVGLYWWGVGGRGGG